uniref:serine carboxypeptidase-like 7 isoform X2 n=1 Tax=Erigeron canadensis TaxID=72917 RepID=UPI001CB97C48|nr:serine carboxypeptidase-like 7 isoform X2 [Erigeron canadensis]
MYLFFILIITIFFNINICIAVSSSSSSSAKVDYLPGFHGPLPFHLETGYVGVDVNEDVQLFYYFIQSESNPEEDPLMLWMSGGPGCSSVMGFLYEIGPIQFEAVKYNGSLPNLFLTPYSWTKMASIIFLDIPAGTGFSYARTTIASSSTDIQYSHQAYEFMRKGYVLGNPLTFPEGDNYQIRFANGMGLISDELYKSLSHSCQGEYRLDYISPNNDGCLRNIELYQECIDGIEPSHVLEPYCRSSIQLASQKQLNEERPFSSLHCRGDGYKLVNYWANDVNVRKALHIRKGTVKEWQRCGEDLNVTLTVYDVRPYHLNLSSKGYRSLIYSGDHDMSIPHQSTEAWVKDLNYHVIDQWRSWKVHCQIAGYTESYSNMMTFATVKGAGHTAPEYKPKECFAMFKRWISHEPL